MDIVVANSTGLLGVRVGSGEALHEVYIGGVLASRTESEDYSASYR